MLKSVSKEMLNIYILYYFSDYIVNVIEINELYNEFSIPFNVLKFNILNINNRYLINHLVL